jgi:uncharacterized cupin superfamily protein
LIPDWIGTFRKIEIIFHRSVAARRTIEEANALTDSLILTARTTVDLRPAPIPKSWIISGNPVAENHVLSKSADGAASTIVWQCSEGKFNWYYDFDETVYILEGSIVVESDAMVPARFGPGDVIFFKRGSHARWHVEGHVRKLAFCRRTLPSFVGHMLKAASKFKRALVLNARPATVSLVDAT